MPNCFLTGLTEKDTILHHLKVFDAMTGDVDDVFVCDSAYVGVCGANDEEVAKCWSVVKQVESSGYTERSAVHTLVLALKGIGFDTSVVTTPEGVSYLVASKTADAVPHHPNVEVHVRSRRPLPWSLQGVLGDLPHQGGVSFDGWLHGRWMFRVPNLETVNQGLVRAFYDAMRDDPLWLELGDPDPFALLVNHQTLAGFELVRSDVV